MTQQRQRSLGESQEFYRETERITRARLVVHGSPRVEQVRGNKRITIWYHNRLTVFTLSYNAEGHRRLFRLTLMTGQQGRGRHHKPC